MEINQDNELSAVKRKIRALLAKTTDAGATESEAMFAMNKVGELLVQYNLSMNEVTLREEPCVTKAFSTGSKQRNVTWNIHSGIAKLLGVKVWFDRRSKGIDWKFFGLESDVDMAIYLYDFIQKAERTASEAFKKTEIYRSYEGHRKILTSNFQSGFGLRINDRLIEIAQENEKIEREAHAFHTAKAAKEGIMVGATDEAQAEAARQKTGTALIVVAKAKKVEEEFKKSGPQNLRTVRTYSHARYNGDARSAGASSANNVNLNRPVSGSGSKSNLRIA